MFSWLEKNPFFFTVAFLVAFSVAGLVEILPDFAKSSRPFVGLKPYSLLETAGRQIYMKEGCYNCHSQLIRPFAAETDRYGMASLSGEYAYDRPFLWGSKRTGPDLHRIGDSRSTDWHENHMFDPTSVVPESIMPAYKHLYNKETDFETAYAEIVTKQKVFKEPYNVENGVQIGENIEEAKKLYLEEANRLAEGLKSEQAAQIKAALENGEVKEIVALIAYLNSLGQSRRVSK